MQATPQAETLGAFFAGQNTIRVAIDLAGLAIAGAFLVVPTFAAVQAWAPEDRRARVVAAVNVVSAGFMTVGGGLVAVIQAAGVSIAAILLGLAAAQRGRRMADAEIPADQCLPRFRLDPVPRLPSAGGRGPGKPQGGRSRRRSWRSTMSASSTVRWRLTLTDEEPVFAIDYTIAQAWWVKPFLKLARACRSTRPSRWRPAR